ncbi:hypothetical protein [Azospira restricta]|uniref:Uncharacterized protein n=1 Tax=Azospira restricta TaxID=404405 RepID=A0A974Y549_9RHOO|nr:hypothetical protein [Azospira restricta]QRJ65060.1 hypothetical protein IWH25_06885 [Azospira restricta]
MQAVEAGPGNGDEGGGDAPSRFVLPRRTFLLALIGIVALLALLIAGGVAFYAQGKAQAAAQAAAQEKARAARAQAAAHDADNLAKLEAARQAHREILETGRLAPPVAPAPPAPQPAVEAVSPAAAVPVAGAAAAPPAAAKIAEKKPAPAQREEASVIVPGPGGGCAVSGSNPQDYGQALGRCLEEFNRLEGRR